MAKRLLGWLLATLGLEPRICKTCRWYEEGACWRFPPMPVHVTYPNGDFGYENLRPFVRDIDDCGEHRYSI